MPALFPLFRAVCFLILLSLCCPSGAVAAELSSRDTEHARNALLFAERGNWREALLHAKKASNPLVRDYITWKSMRDGDYFDFDAFHNFLLRNPNWPDEKKLILNAESQLYEDGGVSFRQKSEWFDKHKPISGKAKIVYAHALKESYGEAKMQEFISRLAREAWRNGDFDASQEKEIIRDFGKWLRPDDYIARIDRLLWEGKTTPASRMMFTVPKAYAALFEARIRLDLNKPGVSQAVAQIPFQLRNDPGLLYSRMKWRERDDQDEGVREILLQTPKTVPYPEKWWPSRHRQVREALDNHDATQALKLLENHGQVEGASKADALWLQGWINLTVFNRPEKAFGYFTELEKTVNYPVSKSRAGYWMGRAATAMKKPEIARKWYGLAAAHPTTFYGQLSALEMGNANLSLPAAIPPTNAQKKAFREDSRVRLVHMLAALRRYDEATAFIESRMENANNYAEAMMTAELGNEIGKQHISVKASKTGLQHNFILPKTSYPYFKVDFTPDIEPSLMWAITRQESLFDPYARSSANAMGMMQLLPSTAKEVARKNGYSYQESSLTTPMYNLKLGSTFLGSLINRFDGSYILAIASYNAGPGRVRQWMEEYGDPGKSPHAAVDWIERIPYSETRNYVQRILENLQVYRAITDPAQGRKIGLNADLVRG